MQFKISSKIVNGGFSVLFENVREMNLENRLLLKMKQEEYYELSVSSLTETTGTLINVHSFLKLPYYKGLDYNPTPNELIIEEAVIDDKIYKIIAIEKSAFSHCLNLKTLRIGKSVEKIEWNMYRCDSLSNIFVDKENKNFYDIDGVLFHKKELIAFPQGRAGTYIIPNGIKKIGKHAFKSCNISKIIFPETLEEIGINAFYGCNNIKEFLLPKSIKKIHPIKNPGRKEIPQKFYLYTDINKSNPLTITEVIKMFSI